MVRHNCGNARIYIMQSASVIHGLPYRYLRQRCRKQKQFIGFLDRKLLHYRNYRRHSGCHHGSVSEHMIRKMNGCTPAGCNFIRCNKSTVKFLHRFIPTSYKQIRKNMARRMSDCLAVSLIEFCGNHCFRDSNHCIIFVCRYFLFSKPF